LNKNFIKIKNLVSSLWFNYNERVPVYWFKGKSNFGDEINKYLVEKLSKKSVNHINPKYFLSKHYFCIGSILERANKHTIVWGSGLIQDNSKVTKPQKIHAVRGPKTREQYLKNNIDCPAIYGDPALLLPLVYTPKSNKKYRIGVIPHYADKTLANQLSCFKSKDIHIIDIQQDNILNFIDEILECDFILSSSLHGLIISDAYNVKNMWIKFSDNVKGDDFKFYDYFESIGRINTQFIKIDTTISLQDIFNIQYIHYTLNIDLTSLLNACPFIDKEILHELKQRINNPAFIENL
jgi:pyruvyltransferase